MAFFKLSDTISGQEDRVYATINGNIVGIFYAKNIEVSSENTKADDSIT